MKEKKSRLFKPRMIDINDFYDVRNSAFSMSVTPEELKEAIRQVGPIEADIKKHLKVVYDPKIHLRNRNNYRF